YCNLEARPYWPHVLGFLLLNLLATPFALLIPLPMKIAVDSVIDSRTLPRAMRIMLPAAWQQSYLSLLFLVAGLVIVFALLTLAHKLAVEMLKTYLGEKLTIGFRSRLFRHVQQLSLSYHDRRGTSDSTYRIQYDAPAIQVVVVEALVPLIGALALLGGMVYVTFRLSPRLALLAVAVCPPLLVLTGIFRNRLRKLWRHLDGPERSRQSIVQEV